MVAAFNPLVRRLLRAGLPMGPNVVLTVRGRSSGELHSFPVALMEAGAGHYVQSPYGEVNWVRNLRVNPEAIVTRGSRQTWFDAVEVAPDDAVVILRAGLDRYLRSRWLAPVARLFTGIRRTSTDAEILEQARLRPMFRLIPKAEQRG
jgi:deazaflavin-dependent oxidoreductase (nitroreductase family)